MFRHFGKSKQMQVALKVPWWCHNSATNFRLVRQGMGPMTSPFHIFRARSILLAFVVHKLILLFTKAGWSAKPYSINFGQVLIFRDHFFFPQIFLLRRGLVQFVTSSLISTDPRQNEIIQSSFDLLGEVSFFGCCKNAKCALHYLIDFFASSRPFH